MLYTLLNKQDLKASVVTLSISSDHTFQFQMQKEGNFFLCNQGSL